MDLSGLVNITLTITIGGTVHGPFTYDGAPDGFPPNGTIAHSDNNNYNTNFIDKNGNDHSASGDGVLDLVTDGGLLTAGSLYVIRDSGGAVLVLGSVTTAATGGNTQHVPIGAFESPYAYEYVTTVPPNRRRRFITGA